ncbi:SurA N-terminal domain-containing protein [Pseudonocardia sp. KRD291]|uniref:SurA N-terminal domain-containing protein n=1 Tax=Pseudonocardia sp. KRD291 TaxID=2792007 RepID=UPI001C4A5CC7|nr:SurA N-terminal domain-containing protein [Pseudonocardia sp. KRD291]MBW0102155.1 SurA N-terminal domain-containing protein [Pseudonocardia sp. KRD291]
MRTRTGKFIAATVIVGALVGGCGTGPSRVDAAAVIGSDTLTLAEVQPRITAALGRPELLDSLRTRGFSEADVGRAVVSQMVLHDLLTRAAAEQDIVVRDEEVDAAVAAAGGEQVLASSTLEPGGAREYVRDQIIATRLAERQVDRLAVTADVAIAPTREEAEQLAGALAAGGARAEQALAGASTAQRGLQIRPSSTPQAAATPLIGIPAGDTALFQLSPEQGWVVVRVTERRTDAPPAGPSAAGRVDRQTLAEAGIRLLAPTAERAGVTVNPRYGVWDPVMLTVAPDAAQVGRIIPAASAG